MTHAISVCTKGRTVPRLSLSLLGPFKAVLEGHLVTEFESDKVRALLAYLAVESDRPHRRETLSALLWPERTDQAASANLRNALAAAAAARFLSSSQRTRS